MALGQVLISGIIVNWDFGFEHRNHSVQLAVRDDSFCDLSSSLNFTRALRQR
jgi:hypothetical protein